VSDGDQTPPVLELSADDLARVIAGSDVPPTPSRHTGTLRKLLIAGLIAGVGVGASVMSCVGQSFSYRQARALEDIAHQFKDLRPTCPAAPAIAH
jgi:hypothetical protein